MKSQLIMNEDNIDWITRFADNEEKSVFDILRENKIQRFELSTTDNALNVLSFDDYLASDIKEISIASVITIGGETEKRKYEFLKTATGWGVIREFKGHRHTQISLEIDENTTTSTNVLTVRVVGTGAGLSADIKVFANTKLSS